MADETGNPKPAIRVPPVASRFKAGQSGNPNGRPKKVENIAQLARDSGEAAIKKLAKLIASDDERVALQAAIAVLDRAVGKPKQSVETTAKKDNTDYTSDELLAIARMGRARIAAQEDGERGTDRLQ